MILRAADYRAMPWKNGGGVTHEIAVWPEGAGMDDFDARISMAEVAADGPFSRFDGIDRTLTLIGGAGIGLAFQDGGTVALTPGAPPLSFPGEAAVTGRLTDGPILDLNVMTRRGRVAHRVVPLAAGQDVADTTMLICRSDTARVAGTDLAQGDAMTAAPQGRVEQGTVLAVWLVWA